LVKKRVDNILETIKIDFVKKRSIEILEHNKYEKGDIFFHYPATGSYSSQFGWDSGFSIISESNLNPENALRELQTIFNFQFDSGQISHEIRIGNENHNFTRKLLLSLVKGQYDEKGRSYLIDPPSYLLAAEALYNRTKDKRVLDLLPSMEACVNYLLEKRDLFGDGLVSIVHPWESGCDFAPIFDKSFNIDVSNRFWGLKYLNKYIKLIRKLKKINWNLDLVRKNNLFIMEDVGMNGITAGGARSISNLYKEAGNLEKSEEYLSKAEKLVESIENHLWNDEKGFFYPRVDIKNPKNVLRSTAMGIAPLISGLVDSDKANMIFENYLLSEDHFNGPFSVSFNSRSELEPHIRFDSVYLWRGPCVWINVNWIVAKAADVYGRRDIAKEITKKSVKLLEKSGYREFYNPMTGIGGGANGYTWSTVVLDMIHDYL